MDTILFKYHCHGNDYLVYDAGKNSISLDARAVRTICTRNFGFGSAGILAGSLAEEGRIRLKQYLPDGSETKTTPLSTQIFGKYLMDAGYVGEWNGDIREDALSAEECAEEVGKMFLSESFLARNHVAVSAAV